MDSNPLPNAASETIQFDRAEPLDSGRTGVATCVGCNQAIVSTYWEIRGSIVCENCRAAFVAATLGGSRAARFFKALGIGLVASLICAAGWYLIVKITGYELGLVAVVVGAVVGIAVRMGAGGRGGWAYQGMAVLLTYLAIASSYVPIVVSGIIEGEIEREAALLKSDGERSRIAIDRNGNVKLNDKDCSTEEALKELERLKAANGIVLYFREGRGEVEPPPSADTIGNKREELHVPVVHCSDASFSEVDGQKLTFGNMPSYGKLMVLSIALYVAIQVPFWSLPSNAIGLLIIGFALWEAWKINKRPIISITGPHILAPQTVRSESGGFLSPPHGTVSVGGSTHFDGSASQ